jgi:hypothetical protein
VCDLGLIMHWNKETRIKRGKKTKNEKKKIK